MTKYYRVGVFHTPEASRLRVRFKVSHCAVKVRKSMAYLSERVHDAYPRVSMFLVLARPALAGVSLLGGDGRLGRVLCLRILCGYKFPVVTRGGLCGLSYG